jgi:hypothetical protein
LFVLIIIWQSSTAGTPVLPFSEGTGDCNHATLSYLSVCD